MGASQLLFLDVDPHASVKETVDAIKLPYGGGAPLPVVKFANAVLRRVQREGKDIWAHKLRHPTTYRDG